MESQSGIQLFGRLNANDLQYLAKHEDVNQFRGFRIGNQEFTLGDFAIIKKNGCPEFESQLDKRPKHIQIMRVFEKGKKKTAMVLWFIKAEHCRSVKLPEGVPPLETDGELLLDRREIPSTIPLSLIEGSTSVTNIEITDIPRKFLNKRKSFFVVRFGLYERHGSVYVKPALLPSKQVSVNGNEGARIRQFEPSPTRTRQGETSPQKARTRPAETSPTRTRQSETSPQKARTRPAETSPTRKGQSETSPQKARTRRAETSPPRDRTRQAEYQSPARTRSETSNSQPDRSVGEIPESQDITDDEDSPPLSLKESRVFLDAKNNKRKLFVPSSQDVRTQPKTPEKPYVKPYHPALGADFDAGPSEAVKVSPRRRINEQSPSRSPYRFAAYDAESQSTEKRTRSQTRSDASPERPLNANTQWASQDLTYSPDKSPVRLRIFKKQNVREVKNTGQNTRNVTVQNKKQPSLFGDSQNSSINTPVDLPFPKKAPAKSVLANALPVHDDEDDNDLFFDEVPQRQQPKQKKITEYNKPVVEEKTSLEEDSSGESTNELVNQVQQTRISFKMPRFADDNKSKGVEFQRITRSGASINEPTPSTSGVVTRRNGPVEPVASTSHKAAVGGSKGPTASTSVDRSGGDRPTASTSGVVTSKNNSNKLTTNISQTATRNGTIEPIPSTSRIVTRRNSTVEPTASTSRTEEPCASTSKDTTRKGPTGRTSQISTRSVSDVSPTKSTTSSLSEEEEDDEDEPTNNVKDGFLASDSDHDDRLMCDGEKKKENESPKKCLFIDVNRPMPKPAIVAKSTAFEDSDEEPPLIPSPLKAARKNPQSSFSPVRVVAPSTVTSPTRMSAMPCNTSPRKSAMNSESTTTRSVPNGTSSPRMSVTNSGGRLNFSFSERRSGGRLNSSFSETTSRNQLNSSFSETRVSPRKSGSRLNPNMNPSVRLSPLSDSVLQKLAESSSADRRENQRQESEKDVIKSPNTVQRQLFSSHDEQPVASSSSTVVKEVIDQALSSNDSAVPGCSGLGATQSDASTDSDLENPLPKELRREMRSSPKKLTNSNLNTSRQELLDCLTTPASPVNCELDHNNSRLKLITSLEDNEVEQHPVMKLFDKNLSLRSSQSENEDSDSARHSAGKRSLVTNSTQSSPSMSPIPSCSTTLKTRTNSSFDSSSYHTARSHGSNSSQTFESPLIIDATPETCRKRKRKSLGPIRIDSSVSTPSTPAGTIQQNPNKDSDNESSGSVKVRTKKKKTSMSVTDSQNSSVSGPSKAPTHQLVIENSDNESSESLRVGKKNRKSLRKVTDSQDSSVSAPSKTLRGQGIIEESDNESSQSAKVRKKETPVKITDIDSQDSSIPALSTPPTRRQRVFEDSDISPIVPRTVQQLIPSTASMREKMKRTLASLEQEETPNLDVDTCGYEDNIGDTQLDDPSYSEFIFGSADAPRKSPRKLSINKPNSPMPSTSRDNNYGKPGTSKDNNYSKSGPSKDDNYSKPSTSKSNNSSSVKTSKITELASKAIVSSSQLLDILNEDTNSMSPKKFQSPAKVTNKSKSQLQERKHSSDTAMAESSSDNEDIQNVHGQSTFIQKPSSEKVNYVDVNLPALENVSINTQLKMIGFSSSKSDSDTSSNFENNYSEMDENSMGYKIKIAEQKQLKRLEEFSAAMRVNSPEVSRKPVPDISPDIQSPVAPVERSVRRKSSTTTPDSPEKLEHLTYREQKEQTRMTRRQSLRSHSTQEPTDRGRSSVSSRRGSEEEPSSGSNVTPRNLRPRTPTPFYYLLHSEDSSPEAKRGRPAKGETAAPREKRAKTPTCSSAVSNSKDFIPEDILTKRGRPSKVQTAGTQERRGRARSVTRASTASDSEDSSPDATPAKRGRPSKVENADTQERRGRARSVTRSSAVSDSEDFVPEDILTKRGIPAKGETAATQVRMRARTPTRSSAVSDSEDFIPEATSSKRGRPLKGETAAPREKRAKTPTRASTASDSEDSSPEATPVRRGRPAKSETKSVATQVGKRNRGRPPKSQKVEEKSFEEEPRTRGRPPASQKDKGPKGKTKKAADKPASSRFLSPTKVDTVEEQEMPGRETEMASIRAFVQRKFEEASGGCMYISGVPGTGKTASVSQVILQLQRMVEEGELPEFKLVKASGMELTQPLQLFSLMARELLDLKLSPSLAQSKLASYFANKDKNRPPTLLIIDELDMLCTRRQDVVYSVFDWPSQTHARLTVLAIANTMDLPERLLKGRVTSRLGLTRLSFKPYTFDQLQQIVMVKLSEAKKFDKDALQLVARKVASVSGDARRAMDVCRRAAEVAGVGKLVEMPHVMSALNEMLSSPIAESVRGCSKLAKHLLRCLLSEMKRTGLEESTLKAVFITMNSTASFHNIPMCSLTQASETVAKLASSRLLRAVDSESGSLGQPLALSVSADDLHYALSAEN